MPAFDPFQYFKGVELEDMARVLFASEARKKNTNFKELVSFQKGTIKTSLLPFQSERMVKEAIEIFEGIAFTLILYSYIVQLSKSIWEM
jgi:hypothetical protein